MKTSGSLARAIESGFIPRKLCLNGHDLSVHGYDWNHGLRCKICDSDRAKKQNKVQRKGQRWTNRTI